MSKDEAVITDVDLDLEQVTTDDASVKSDEVQTKPQQTQTKMQPASKPELKVDRAKDFDALQSKFERLETMMQLSKHADIIDVDIVTDLVHKGWDLGQLRESKPYLFVQKVIKDQDSQNATRNDTVKKVIAESKSPKIVGDDSTYNDKFVSALINELKVPNFD